MFQVDGQVLRRTADTTRTNMRHKGSGGDGRGAAGIRLEHVRCVPTGRIAGKLTFVMDTTHGRVIQGHECAILCWESRATTGSVGIAGQVVRIQRGL